MLRLLILFLALWVAWKMFQNYQHKKERLRRGNRLPARETMVKCEYCALHLPEKDAVAHEALWFCSPQHRARFLKDGKDQGA